MKSQLFYIKKNTLLILRCCIKKVMLKEQLFSLFYNIFRQEDGFNYVSFFPDVLPHEVMHPEILIWMNSKSRSSLYCFLYVFNINLIPFNQHLKPEYCLVGAIKNSLEGAINKIRILISEFKLNLIHNPQLELNVEFDGYILQNSNLPLEEFMLGSGWKVNLNSYTVGKILYVTELFEKILDEPVAILNISLDKFFDMLKILGSNSMNNYFVAMNNFISQNISITSCKFDEKQITDSITSELLNNYLYYAQNSKLNLFIQKIRNLSNDEKFETITEIIDNELQDYKCLYWDILDLTKFCYLLDFSNFLICKKHISQIKSSLKKVIKKRISEFIKFYCK